MRCGGGDGQRYMDYYYNPIPLVTVLVGGSVQCLFTPSKTKPRQPRRHTTTRASWPQRSVVAYQRRMHAFRSLRSRSAAPLTVAVAGLWASSSRFERCEKENTTMYGDQVAPRFVLTLPDETLLCVCGCCAWFGSVDPQLVFAAWTCIPCYDAYLSCPLTDSPHVEYRAPLTTSSD